VIEARGNGLPSDRFVRLARVTPSEVLAAKSKPKPSVALDRRDRGIKPPSYLQILKSMENWDDVEFPDVP
jgi:hypothetical protein